MQDASWKFRIKYFLWLNTARQKYRTIKMCDSNNSTGHWRWKQKNKNKKQGKKKYISVSLPTPSTLFYLKNSSNNMNYPSKFGFDNREIIDFTGLHASSFLFKSEEMNKNVKPQTLFIFNFQNRYPSYIHTVYICKMGSTVFIMYKLLLSYCIAKREDRNPSIQQIRISICIKVYKSRSIIVRNQYMYYTAML